MKTGYLHDSNGYYVGEVNVFKDSFGNYLIPANVSLHKPRLPEPPKKRNKLVDDKWILVDDYSNPMTEYWDSDADYDDEPIRITEPGIIPPPGALFVRPPKSLNRRKTELKGEVMMFYKEIRETILPSDIAQEYSDKAKAAEKITAGNALLDDLAVIDPEAKFRGISVEILAEIIVKKASAAKTAAGILAAERIAALAAIEGIEDETDLAAVTKKLVTKREELMRFFKRGNTSNVVDDEPKNKKELSRKLSYDIATIQSLAKNLSIADNAEVEYTEIAQKLTTLKNELSRQFGEDRLNNSERSL